MEIERHKKVVDASVIVKIFLNEEKSIEALKLLDSHLNEEIEILVPELIFLEVINALRYKKDVKEKNLIEANRLLESLQFSVVNVDYSLLDVSIKISLKYNLSLYDSIYAAISSVYGYELITQDEKLLKVSNTTSL